MTVKTLIISLVLLALAGGGAFALYQRGKIPDISQIRANPALFQFRDYSSKATLHTRLSALFPRGTPEEAITEFFKTSGHTPTAQSEADCLITRHYSRARFHIGAADKTLVGIQVRDDNGSLWPRFVPDCAEPRINTLPQRERAEVLTPDTSSTEQPIHLPLEPIPGLEQAPD